jgi:hypothetical protein
MPMRIIAAGIGSRVVTSGARGWPPERPLGRVTLVPQVPKFSAHAAAVSRGEGVEALR